MKRVLIAMSLVLMLLSLTACGSATSDANTVIDGSQQAIVNDILLSLQGQGIPVTSFKLVDDGGFNPPVVVNFVLQGNPESPDNAIYTNLIGHEVNLAQKKGLDVGAFSIILVDAEGNILNKLTGAIVSEDEIQEIMPPQNTDDSSVVAFLRQNLDLFGMSLTNLELTRDKDSLRILTIELEVAGLQTAKDVEGDFMWTTQRTIEKFNLENGLAISCYRINIWSENGELFVKYINDLQLRRESWWEIDGLNGCWWPSPPIISN